MPDLQPFQKMLWAKAKAAGVTLPNDSDTAAMSKAEIDTAKTALERGEDFFGRSVASGAAPSVDSGLIDVLTGIRTALERIADAAERRG